MRYEEMQQENRKKGADYVTAGQALIKERWCRKKPHV